MPDSSDEQPFVEPVVPSAVASSAQQPLALGVSIVYNGPGHPLRVDGSRFSSGQPVGQMSDLEVLGLLDEAAKLVRERVF